MRRGAPEDETHPRTRANRFHKTGTMYGENQGM
jgi:hypothetical protein